MPQRFSRRLKFLVERFMVRGAHSQLLVVAAVIGLISVAGGMLVLGDAEFETRGEATWWAFLRLSDPGYLGDDTGTLRRTVSTVLTVLGYVVFLGALVAIMTEWLQATMRGETALGVFRRSQGLGAEQLHLNPPPASRWRLTDQDELVVLTRDE